MGRVYSMRWRALTTESGLERRRQVGSLEAPAQIAPSLVKGLPMAATLQAPVAFDPDKFRQTTRAQWESAAEAWDRWGPLVGRWLGPATETMLDMAGIGPGSRVLDVAAGAGEQ